MCPAYDEPLQEPAVLLAPLSAAATANATSSGFDTQGWEGPMKVVVATGAITGTMTPKIQDSDVIGSGYADVPGLSAAVVSTADQVREIDIPAGRVKRFIRLVGTIATGPVLIGAVVVGKKKTTG